ncbi:hypothetical protein KAX02_07445 [candidate division WOR-3 bacterium]|nr:hypothetical protein [candidate division WOR-3 bacterium]
MSEEEKFESEMNDPIIVIDKTHIPEFLRHRFSLWIHNTSDDALYFKIVEELPNWTLGSIPGVPADGKLGVIAAGVSKHFVGVVERYLPAGESEDVGSFIVECYPDDTYTGLIESHLHPTTIHIEDLENWTNVQKFDFDDGTAQGWTLSDLVVSSGKSIEDGGYSLSGVNYVYAGSATKTPYLSKSVVLPNTTKVKLSLYWFFHWYKNSSQPTYHRLDHLRVYVDGVEIYTCFNPDYSIFDLTKPSPGVTSGDFGWFKIGVDLSAFKGETVVIKIEAQTYAESQHHGNADVWLDDVVISGKD